MEKLCTECKLPLILRPAGVAKATGNPYDAFWACSSGQRHKQTQSKAQFNNPQNEIDPLLIVVENQNEILRKLDEVLGILKKETPF